MLHPNFDQKIFRTMSVMNFSLHNYHNNLLDIDNNNSTGIQINHILHYNDTYTRYLTEFSSLTFTTLSHKRNIPSSVNVLQQNTNTRNFRLVGVRHSIVADVLRQFVETVVGKYRLNVSV